MKNYLSFILLFITCFFSETLSARIQCDSDSTIVYNGCEGDGFCVIINGNTYNENTPSGIEVIPNYLDCDSIIYIDLNFSPLPDAEIILPTSSLFCTGIQTILRTESSPNHSYSWTGSDNFVAYGDSILSNINYFGENETYYLHVTSDITGCSNIDSYTFSSSSNAVIEKTIIEPNCNLSNGEISISITLSDFLPTENIFSETNLPPGTYNIYHELLSDCVYQETITLSDAETSFSISSITHDTCGLNTGAATLLPETATYEWDNGNTSNTASNLAAGTYYVTATYDDGCQAVQAVEILYIDAPNLSISSITYDTCGLNTGQVTVSTPEPATYLWSNGSTSNTVSNLAKGTHTVTATFDNGCQTVQDIEILPIYDFPFTTIQSIIHDSCGMNTGKITLTPNEEDGISYLWSNGSSSNSISNLATGIYSVTIISSYGCSSGCYSSINDIEILSIDSPTFSVNIINDADFGVNNGHVILNPPTANYQWDNGETAHNISGLAHGIYSVTATFENGCQSVQEVEVPCGFNPNIQAELSSDLEKIKCNDQTVVLSASTIDTSGTFTYSFYPNSEGEFASIISDSFYVVDSVGIYGLTIHDSEACWDTTTITIEADTLADCIFPGDTNKDFIVNNKDILAICVGMGKTGPPRNTTGIEWDSYYGENWLEESFPNVDNKHLDCNGTGTIDRFDLSACTNNYNAEHDGEIALRVTGEPIVRLEYNGPYFIDDDNSLVIGDIIIEGEDGGDIENFYGIAFSIEYDSSFVKEGSAEVVFNDPSWLGTASEVVTFYEDFYEHSKTDVAISRDNLEPVSGSGIVAQFSIIIDDDLIGRTETPEYSISMNITDLYAINVDGENIVFGGEADDIEFSIISSNVNLITEGLINVYPNPANNYLTIDTKEIDGHEYALYNALGQEIEKGEIENRFTHVNMKPFKTGVYFLHIRTEDGNAIVRILKE